MGRMAYFTRIAIRIARHFARRRAIRLYQDDVSRLTKDVKDSKDSARKWRDRASKLKLKLDKERVKTEVQETEIQHLTDIVARDRERVLAETANFEGQQGPRQPLNIQIPQAG